MKKKIVALVGGLTMVALSVAFFADKSDAQASLLMQNVEAIAQNEGGTTGCCPGGGICIIGGTAIYGVYPGPPCH